MASLFSGFLVEKYVACQSRKSDFRSRANMCFNCSLSVKSMKFGMMIVFKALKKIGYGAIAKKFVKCEK